MRQVGLLRHQDAMERALGVESVEQQLGAMRKSRRMREEPEAEQRSAISRAAFEGANHGPSSLQCIVPCSPWRVQPRCSTDS